MCPTRRVRLDTHDQLRTSRRRVRANAVPVDVECQASAPRYTHRERGRHDTGDVRRHGQDKFQQQTFGDERGREDTYAPEHDQRRLQSSAREGEVRTSRERRGVEVSVLSPFIYLLRGAARLSSSLSKDPTNTRWTRGDVHRKCAADEHNEPTSLGTAPNRRRLSGADVHLVRADRAILEGVREEQLPQREVGAVSHEGKRVVPDSGESHVRPHIPYFILRRVRGSMY